MKITQLKTDNGGDTNPCELVSKYLMHEEGKDGTLSTFLTQFEFDSREEVEKAIRLFIRTVTLDRYMRQKHLGEHNPLAAAVYTRYSKIFMDEGKLTKMPMTMSGEIWHGGFSRQLLEDRTSKIFGGVEPNARKFAATCDRLREIYGMTNEDIAKLHFFVEQVKAGDAFPNSLRRMLYFWGMEKKTGKTTVATMMVSLLNGDMDEKHIARYSTDLTNEMQFKSFTVPKISECNVCLMDECFYNDMAKTYADFKRFITSSNGRARLPFGQEFEWEGQPNYIATSNESLKKFIKDWGDRRYLSIEFKTKPKKKMTSEEIKQLWLDFILNSQQAKEWSEWADEIAGISDERGERQEIADDLEIELRKLFMLDRVINLHTPSENPACAENHVPLKMFVDWFSETMGSVEAHKRKGEIEAAVLKVYGARYSTTGYWLLSELRKTAMRLKEEINRPDDNDAVEMEDEETEKLPF